MAKVHFLGTASAVSNRNQENTHLVVEMGNRLVLVDCGGNPVARMQQAGIDPLSISDLIVTHFHPDHVSGFSLLLMDLWLMGRENVLNIYGLADVLKRAEQMMELFDWRTWGGFYPVNFHPLPSSEKVLLFETEDISVVASQTCHMVPSIGIRFQCADGAICYSSDTGPCEALVRLAEGVDVLIHEASGRSHGHSSPAQAGEIAQKANAKTLVLIHYPPDIDYKRSIAEARKNFAGEVMIAEDLMTVVL